MACLILLLIQHLEKNLPVQCILQHHNSLIGIDIMNICTKNSSHFRLKATVFENEEQTQDRRVAILRNTSFQGFPPCLLIAAELDRFRDDSYGILTYNY